MHMNSTSITSWNYILFHYSCYCRGRDSQIDVRKRSFVFCVLGIAHHYTNNLETFGKEIEVHVKKKKNKSKISEFKQNQIIQIYFNWYYIFQYNIHISHHAEGGVK